MTVKEALKRIQELLYEDDDMISQDNLFEAQDLIDQVINVLDKKENK